MTTVVIHGEGLGKRYRRGVRVDSGLRHSLERLVRSPFSAFRRSPGETFWALRDVSLEVREGEVLGLIGRNGAGKTTLLKILSRITRPTTGWAEIHGRVGSLLEVGTGFHSELTGRENTFVSGAILGMRRAEITRKFDEIVAFAELEKFIDTPVKHYSSGMYVRLAFAVAAHLEPEILLVDEVLAVGDINFQTKCLGKMGDVARAGRTVVLVSHQLNQIRRLCHRVVWIDAASVRQDGPTHEVVSAYESAMARGERLPEDRSSVAKQVRPDDSKASFVKWAIANPRGDNPHTLIDLDPVTVEITVNVRQPIKAARHGIALYTHEQQLVWGCGPKKLQLEIGEHQLCHTFPMLPLRPGSYNWLVSLYDDADLVDFWNCVPDMIVTAENHQSSYDEWTGVLNIPDSFQVGDVTTPMRPLDETASDS
jgi:lipopolysaccharide transport system ATP-binding protein